MKKFLTMLIASVVGLSAAVPTLKVGHVGHDHQSALYVAIAEAARTEKDAGIHLKEIQPKKIYDLYEKGEKIAEVVLSKAGGGSKMPAAMAQGQFDIGLGGVAAIAFFNDKGTPMKIVSPLQIKGDMLVVQPDNKVSNWDEFVTWAKESKEQIRIGYKSPKAVAKIVFERALKEVGITFTDDPADKDSKILMVNLKSGKEMNPSLKNKIVDGYVMNTPATAVAQAKGFGKIVVDLNDLPPGIYKDHPCCAMGATNTIMSEHPKEVKALLKLIILGTNYINEDLNKTAEHVGKFIGTSHEIEKISMKASGYTSNPDEAYRKTLNIWIDDMNNMGHLKGNLKGKTGSEAINLLCDFSLIEEAAKELSEAGVKEQF